MLRIKNRAEKEKHDFENGWNQTRHIWATLINIHSTKKVKPSDLIELSIDKGTVSTTVRKTPEEVAKKFGLKRK